MGVSAQFPVSRPYGGYYVSLEVHYSGVGMDAQMMAIIFDPFFTTKFTRARSIRCSGYWAPT